MAIRIILTSDNHLDAYYAKMNPQTLEERRKKIRQAFQETIDWAIEKEAHLYLHCGDLFDIADPRNVELAFVAGQFKRLYDNKINSFFISGTHDTPKIRQVIESIPQRIFHEVGQIFLFSRQTEIEVRTLQIADLKVAIGGLCTNHRVPPQEDPLAGLEFTPTGDINILLLHYGIETHVPFGYRDPIIHLKTLDNLQKVNYIFAGHSHKTEAFNIDNKHIIIPGATERLDFGEIENPTGFYYLEVDETGLQEVEYIKTVPQPMKQIQIDLTELKEEPTQFIMEQIRKISQPDQLLKCKLIGRVSRDMFHQIGFREIWLEGTAQNFYFDIDTQDLQVAAETLRAYSGARFSQPEEIRQVVEQFLQDPEKCKTEEDRDLIRQAENLILSRLS